MTVGLGFGLFTFAVYVLAAARVVRFINHDTLLDPLRIAIARIFGLNSTALEFISCAWCVSIWVGAATAWIPVVIVGLPWWWVFLVILATSHLVGVAAPLSSDEEMEIETVEVQ
jgi:hypothetical protein